MKALTFHGVRDVRVERVDDPQLIAPGDVLLRVVRSAVCGSDLHVYAGRETGLDAGPYWATSWWARCWKWAATCAPSRLASSS